MPIQKDLKKIVRARMQKTGEAYTTARSHVISKKKAPEPPPDYALLAGMSDTAVEKATGRGWNAWVTTLDAIRANEKSHREIAEYVSSLGTPDWWSQMVTVGYERIRGLRDKGQRRGGNYEANKSRTFPVPVERLYEAFADATQRKQWLPLALNVRTANANKTMRTQLDDGALVQFYFMEKGASKSSVAVTHEKLADKEAAERMKQWWGERLDALAEMLG
jgi:uncharacterized protein YndB with AHSA1/START domain